MQAAAAFEAGLTADPNNSALRSGLQQAHQGLAADLLSGKTLAHIKALPAPAAPERITLTPHNSTQGLSLRLQGGGGINSDSSGGAGSSKLQRRGHQVGWKGAGDAVDVLLTAAEAVSHALASAAAEAAAGDSAGDSDAAAVVSAGGALQLLPTGAAQSFDAGSWQLPKVLLTPAAAASDVGLQDVYEYLSTQVRRSGRGVAEVWQSVAVNYVHVCASHAYRLSACPSCCSLTHHYTTNLLHHRMPPALAPHCPSVALLLSPSPTRPYLPSCTPAAKPTNCSVPFVPQSTTCTAYCPTPPACQPGGQPLQQQYRL